MSDLRDFTDKSVAWDALARKNIEVTNLKTEIASLKAQLDGNRAAFNLKCAQLDKAEAQLASARKALEPFAVINVPSGCQDKLSIMGIDRLVSRLTVGDLRAAKVAYTDEKGK